MVAAAPVRQFVPAQIDAADFSQLEPLYRQLLDRPIETASEAEHWLADFSELSAFVDEYGARRYIEKSCHTDDPEIEKAYLHFVENIEPQTKPLCFRLQQKFLASPGASQLSGPRYAILTRKWKADVELYRDENVPLETEVTKLSSDYDKISGAMTANFRGHEYTLQQLSRFIEEPDRPTRQEAWETIARRRLQDREAIESLFDRILPLRESIARNAGMSDYRAYIWKAYKRFDYTPEDCRKFADAVAETCVPLMHEMDRQRQQDLAVNRLRPWDLSVDPKNRPPLRPFDESNVTGFIDGVKSIFSRLSPKLADDFESLRTHNNLDLQSRKGKQPGGYQSTLEESREPFIFMNASGMQSDVITLLHEGGHAFHALAAFSEPLVFLRSAPMEFCEVASMSMELLGADHFDVFYNSDEAARAKRVLLERVVGLLPWIAIIDSFQHWIYTHPGHSRDDRTAEWLRLQDRFASRVDWAGYEDARAAMWQRQLHLFHAPFYYIEYGIAQLGALQLWLMSKQDPHRALTGYRAALALGGTRTLPELFSAAGIVFDFSAKTVGPLMAAVRDELQELPT
ncbi:MAG TPA: M3 family oligoendopeptidase [Tepidisphaeraceae bacterium]|nr:M3 family oligoendopeptidase [Tepidisphaeraceae bacterium]